jgi:hypothetical protein
MHIRSLVGTAPPVIIFNDQMSWDELKPLLVGPSRAFDNVVISPGPGTPERPEDTGERLMQSSVSAHWLLASTFVDELRTASWIKAGWRGPGLHSIQRRSRRLPACCNRKKLGDLFALPLLFPVRV